MSQKDMSVTDKVMILSGSVSESTRAMSSPSFKYFVIYTDGSTIY